MKQIPCVASIQLAMDYALASGCVSRVVMAVALVALPLLLLYAGRFIKWWNLMRKLRTAAAQYPHRPRHWFLGNMAGHPGLVGDVAVQHILGYIKEFPRVCSFFIGPFKNMVVCCHPETVKVILRTSEPKTMANYASYSFIIPWLGNGLLISTGDIWHRNRKLLTPAFHFDVLKPYSRVYNNAADKMIAKWQTMVKTDPSVEIYQHVSLCTLDVIMRCALSYEEDLQAVGGSHPYVSATISLAKLVVHRIFTFYLYPDFIFDNSASGRAFWRHVNLVHQMAYDIISSRKKSLGNPEERRKRYLDFLDILLLARDDEGKGLTDHEIRQEVDTFLFEGHDTTASAISWCLYNLAKYPEEQVRARKEIDDLLNDRANRDVEFDDLNSLPYLTMCVKESLRLNPPVPFVERELTQPLELEGHILPPLSPVTINIFAVHHNPAVWGPDYMEFKPERFAPERLKQMDSHAFIPFSAGPRNCIGQNFAMHEVKTIVGKIVYRLELAIDEKHHAEPAFQLVLRSKDGIQLLLTPRP